MHSAGLLATKLTLFRAFKSADKSTYVTCLFARGVQIMIILIHRPWAAISIRHCPQPSSVLHWTSLPSRPLAGSSPSSQGLHSCIASPPDNWRQRIGRPRQSWLRTVEADLQPMNLGLVTATRSGPIGLAENRGKGYVVPDTILKKKEEDHGSAAA